MWEKYSKRVVELNGNPFFIYLASSRQASRKDSRQAEASETFALTRVTVTCRKVARSFKEVLSGYELFEDNIVDFKYMLFDINRMDDEELLDIATLISSVFSLDQSGINDEEIIRRLKVIGRFIRMKATKDQSKIFRNWIVNILQNRMDEEMKNYIQDVFEKTGEMEADDMVSNLGKNLEESINKKVNSAKKESVIEIAKNLLDVLSHDVISKKTGLTIDIIKKLREDAENLIH